MFKRVARRQKRKEEEEDLGLTEEMKEVMGMQDTDSSESDSNSDDNSDSDSEGSGEDIPKLKGQKRKRGVENEEELGSELTEGSEGEDGELEGELEEDDGEEEGQDEEEGESDEDEEPTMSISAALQNPLHVVSLDPEIRTCVVCPGKLLKNAKMIEVHMASNVCLPFSSFCSSSRSFPFPSCLYIPNR